MKTALIIGDSHVEPGGSFAPALAKLLQAQGYIVTIAGVGSSNGFMWATRQIVCRPDHSRCVDQSTLPHSPDLLVVSLGTNDAANAAAGGRSVTQAVADIKKAISQYDAKRVFWIGPPATRDGAVQYYTNAAIAAFYDAAGPIIYDSRPATLAAVRAGQGDGVHLYGAGAQTWANAVAEAIRGMTSTLAKVVLGASVVGAATAVFLWHKGYFR